MFSCAIRNDGIFSACSLSFVLSVALALGMSRRAVIPTSKFGMSVLLSLASKCGPIVMVRVIDGLRLKDTGSPMVTCAFKVLVALKFIMSIYARSPWPKVAVTGKVL
jgi:hypothetical protein